MKNQQVFELKAEGSAKSTSQFDIEDFLPLYIGSECIFKDEDGNDHVYKLDAEIINKFSSSAYQLILKGTMDIQQLTEVKKFMKYHDGYYFDTPESILYLIKNGIDAFGLIGKGIAISYREKYFLFKERGAF